MWGHPLNIEEGDAVIAKSAGEVYECGLRRVGLPMEHRFPRKQGANSDAVDAPDEFTGFVSSLDRMGPTELMELGVGGEDLPVDPTVGPTRVGAVLHHLNERFVDGEVKLFHRAFQ